MHYYSSDRIQDFEFHDAELSLITWDDYHLVVSAKHLNVHKDAAPNNTGTDMEISEARIAFDFFKIKEFEPGRTWKSDENGTLHTDDPLIIHTDATAREMFKNELSHSITVLDIGFEDGVYWLDATGIDPFFSVRFVCSSISIEWDDYSKKAWYELHSQLQKRITLSTPTGKTQVDMRIICHDEDVYYCGEGREEEPSILVGIEYEGKKIWGHGTDYLWADAFADLQKQLPDHVKLTCCLTCRHGNWCPAGNKPGEVFCTKDVIIKDKLDAFFYTVEDPKRDKRACDYTHVCEDFQAQTEDYYTYNDYLHFLNK